MHSIIPSNRFILENLALNEGFAQGVTKLILVELYEKTNNEDFLSYMRVFNMGALRTARTSICNQFCSSEVFLSGNNDEICRKHCWDMEEDFGLLMNIKDEHVLGEMLFNLREAQWGARIYGDILKHDYCTIMSSPKERLCK